MATPATRDANRRAIKETVNWFSPGGDFRGLHVIATRESNLNHYVSAKSQLDRKGARRAWDKRMHARLRDHGNPYLGPEYQHEEQGGWWNSYGLFQLMAPYHVPGWSWTAPPAVLLHPIISTVVAARLWNRGVRAGAKNLCELRSFWKYGKLGVDPTPEARCANTRQRIVRMGYPASLADKPLRSFGLQGFGTGPTSGQNESFRDVANLLGLPASGAIGPEWSPGGTPDLPPPPPPPPPVTPATGPAGSPIIAPGPVMLVVLALFGADLIRRRRR